MITSILIAAIPALWWSSRTQNVERSRSPLLLYLYLCIQTGMTKMFTKCQRTKDNVMEAEAEHLEVGRVPSPIPPYCEVGCGDGRNSAAATCPYCSNSYIHVYIYVCTMYVYTIHIEILSINVIFFYMYNSWI